MRIGSIEVSSTRTPTSNDTTDSFYSAYMLAASQNSASGCDLPLQLEKRDWPEQDLESGTLDAWGRA